TKGAFFHHFKSKEDVAVAAADHWSANTAEIFSQAAYHDRPDPLDRVLAYIDMRVDLISGALPEFTCFAGTLTQEVFLTHPVIREACCGSIFGHARTLEEDLAEAIEKYQPPSGLTAHSLAIHTQAVVHMRRQPLEALLFQEPQSPRRRGCRPTSGLARGFHCGQPAPPEP
ncbi:TetR/AcrR family transcriptional regulator, partial [Roseiarcus sp.]|uniref:TetR/AcrR family transcriptional regulator n=1 Tax=Roseiarcus sp. TaxID=1969460 RepID=UPI003D1528FD